MMNVKNKNSGGRLPPEVTESSPWTRVVVLGLVVVHLAVTVCLGAVCMTQQGALRGLEKVVHRLESRVAQMDQEIKAAENHREQNAGIATPQYAAYTHARDALRRIKRDIIPAEDIDPDSILNKNIKTRPERRSGRWSSRKRNTGRRMRSGSRRTRSQGPPGRPARKKAKCSSLCTGVINAHIRKALPAVVDKVANRLQELTERTNEWLYNITAYTLQSTIHPSVHLIRPQSPNLPPRQPATPPHTRVMSWTDSHLATDDGDIQAHNSLFRLEGGQYLSVPLAGTYYVYTQVTYHGHNMNFRFTGPACSHKLYLTLNNETLPLLDSSVTQHRLGRALPHPGQSLRFPRDAVYQGGVFMLHPDDQLHVELEEHSMGCHVDAAPSSTYLGAFLVQGHDAGGVH